MFNYMITGAARSMVAFVLGVAVLTVALAYGVLPMPSLAAEVAAEPVSTVHPVQHTRENVPTVQAPFYAVQVAEDDNDLDTLKGVNAPEDVELAAFRALIDDGARGSVNDGDASVYARIGRVLDFGTGTITVTMFGAAICVDNDVRACTGSEFLTDYYLWGA